MDTTPLLNIEGIFFKREDQNPSGSIKDRGMSFQVTDAVKKGQRHLVISSSGNAAISAAFYCQQAELSLDVFVSPRTSKGKLNRLKNMAASVHVMEKPLSASLHFAQENCYRHLRQSMDPVALQGYVTLARELSAQLLSDMSVEDQVSIFFPVSSGATILGVYMGLKDLQQKGKIKSLPQLHAVQTTFVHPIAEEFTSATLQVDKEKGLGLASALCAANTPLKSQVVTAIKETGGSGWIVTEAEIQSSWSWLSGREVETSAEGAAALAGFLQAKSSGLSLGLPLILLTGKKYDD